MNTTATINGVTNERPAVPAQDPLATGRDRRMEQAMLTHNEAERNLLKRVSEQGLLEEMASAKSRLDPLQWQMVKAHTHCHCDLCSDDVMSLYYTSTQCQYMRAARELRRRYQVGQVVRVRSPYYGLCCDATVKEVGGDGVTVTLESGAETYAPFETIIK